MESRAKLISRAAYSSDPEDGGDMFLRTVWLSLNILNGVISQKISTAKLMTKAV
jgi:hypothetical protein